METKTIDYVFDNYPLFGDQSKEEEKEVSIGTTLNKLFQKRGPHQPFIIKLFQKRFWCQSSAWLRR